MSEMTNKGLFKLVTIENLLGLFMGIAAVSASYALTSYKLDEAEEDIASIQLKLKQEEVDVWQIKSDVRDIKTHLDYQKKDLHEIKEILKAGH